MVTTTGFPKEGFPAHTNLAGQPSAGLAPGVMVHSRPHSSIFSQHLLIVSYTFLHYLNIVNVLSYYSSCLIIWTTGCWHIGPLSMSAVSFFHVVSLSLSHHLWRQKPGSSQLLTSKRQTISNISCIKSSYKIARELCLKAQCDCQILSAKVL